MKTASNTNRTEMVKALKELEAKAKRPRIAERRAGISSYMREALPNATIVDTNDSVFALGEDIAAFHKEADAKRYVALSNAAPWLLAVAGAFQPGDGEILADWLYQIEEEYGEDGTDPRDQAITRVLRRLQAAAKEMER